MDTITSQSSITLVIKAPNQRIRDIEVSCLLDWTVEKLKSHLANVYPTKPARSSQKIIYSGKLLDDHFVLKDVLLESHGKQQTVHLVCTPSTLDNSHYPLKTPAREPPTTQATVPEVSSALSTSTTLPDGLRHRPHHSYPQHAFYNMYNGNLPTSPSNGQHGVFPVNTDTNGAFSIPGQPYLYPSAHHFSEHSALYAAHHVAHMQWLHHMAQVMQGVPYMPVQQPISCPQQTVTQQPTPVNPPAAAPPAPQAQERRENRAQNRNRVMNANGGGGLMEDEDDNDDENIQRDWLDYIYVFVRIMMLMSIFWFYSSAERIILMAVAMFLAWLVQSGWFNLIRSQRIRQQGQQADAFNNPEANHEVERDDDEDEDAEETDSETEDTDETDGNTTTESNNSTEPSYPGYLVVGFNFITSFFTSLIPQGPRAVAQG